VTIIDPAYDRTEPNRPKELAMDVTEVAADLVAEQDALDEIVGQLPDDQWMLDTPSARWSVGDQIGHLTYFDGTAALAILDPDAFRASIGDLMAAAGAGGDEGVDQLTMGEFRQLTPDRKLAAWRENRLALSEASIRLANDTRVAWYGPSMGSKSFLTARLMEAWAHGQDIVDAVGAQRPATDRLRHIAQLGYITRKWTYINRGAEAPDGDVRVELISPSGATWSWGESDDASVTGDALDFCLVVTQRRNVADTGLAIKGDRAIDWMTKAQAFAGPPTDGPMAGAF